MGVANMSELLQSLRVNRHVVHNDAKDKSLSGQDSPYTFLIYKNKDSKNAEAILNLNCPVQHIYFYIQERFSASETGIFIDLRKHKRESGLQVLEAKTKYRLVRIKSGHGLDAINSVQDVVAAASNCMMDANGQKQEKFLLEPMFCASSDEMILLKNINSGKRKKPTETGKKKHR